MLCQYGYFFPVNDSKTLTLKDDSSLYRFQVKINIIIYIPVKLYDNLNRLCIYYCLDSVLLAVFTKKSRQRRIRNISFKKTTEKQTTTCLGRLRNGKRTSTK